MGRNSQRLSRVDRSELTESFGHIGAKACKSSLPESVIRSPLSSVRNYPICRAREDAAYRNLHGQHELADRLGKPPQPFGLGKLAARDFLRYQLVPG